MPRERKVGNSRRFIEESFPAKEVSIESAKEKNIRHGHISTLHIWWARRPLASSRATNYAALIPAIDPNSNPDEWNNKRDFIIEFSKWENSLNQTMIQKAREDILKANGGKPPKVLDPFAGGGAIPLEALRLGCETYASDYNPVATLILKCTLEYPQKYSRPQKVASDDWTGVEKTVNPLLEDVKKWGDWVLNEAKKEIGRFYPLETDGSVPVGYIWARTIPCPNPTCGAEIPLMRQFWLVKKAKRKVSLSPFVAGGKVEFKIVGVGHEPMPAGFDPEAGTVSRAVATCQVCGGIVDDDTTRQLFQQGKDGQKMVAVVTHKEGIEGKKYRLAVSKDIQIFQEAEKYLAGKRLRLATDWGMEAVPDEELPPKETLGFRVQRYGILKWGDLFNSRQKLALVTFVEKVRASYKEMLEEGYDGDYAKAVVSYLALLVSRLSNRMSFLAYWFVQGEKIQPTFVRQALAMTWDYIEMNPFNDSSGGWETNIFDGINVLTHLTAFGTTRRVEATQCSATRLPYPDEYFDAVLTDPPYYDNVPYSYLSDYFYVWLKRAVGDLYPDLFSTPLTPKRDEIVAYSNGPGGFEGGKQFFEGMLRKSLKEIFRVLKPSGVATIVYAHKSAEGWETLINSLLDSGLITTGAWPINTEMGTRLRASESAALASSIYIATRKMARQPTGFYNNVQEELKRHLNKKLDRLWQEGIGGADFFIAAIGSAIEVFGKYEKVMDYEGNIVRADRLLQDVRHIATDYAVRQILHNGFAGEISDLTRFYVLYRWNYGEAKVEFDEARKLAQSCNIDLAKEWNRGGFIRKDKEFIKVIGPQDRQLEDLKNSNDLLDVLHTTLLLWEKGKRDDIVKLLHKSGYGKGEAFYRVGQAISETLPIDSKEKKLLDGCLSGRERLVEEIRTEAIQRRLL
jgi:putative DNA methylase